MKKIWTVDGIPAEFLPHHVVDLTSNIGYSPSVLFYEPSDILSQTLSDEERQLKSPLTSNKIGVPSTISNYVSSMVSSSCDSADTCLNINMPIKEDDQQSGEQVTKICLHPYKQTKLQALLPLRKIRHCFPRKDSSLIINLNHVDAQHVSSQQVFELLTTCDSVNLISSDHDDSASLEDFEVNDEKRLPHKKRKHSQLKKASTATATRSSYNKCSECIKCVEQFSSQSTHSRKLQISVKKNKFVCELCDELYSDQLVFFEHLKNHYEPPMNVNDSDDEIPQLLDTHTLNVVEDIVSIKDMECSTGDHQINETDDKYVNEEMPYLKCDKSGQLFRSEGTFDCHMSISHPDQEAIEEFSEPEDMMEGIRDVVNMVPIGDEEDSSFDFWNSENNVECALIQPQVNKSDTSTCLISTRRLTPSSAIEGNEVKEEKTETISDNVSVMRKARKEMQCSHCGRKFVHRNSLLYHMHSHTGHRPHQCKECGKSFFVAGALKIHQRLHSGDKPYKCEYCGRSFRQWGDLKYHFTSLHSNTKMFQCEYCGKDFARKYSLVVHRRIHTGEKNYRCEYCMKTFRAASYLQNHRRIHTGEKPHPCTICGKPFRVRSDMKRHMKTHPDPESVNVLNDMSNNVAESNSSNVKEIFIVNNNRGNDGKQEMHKTAIVNLETIPSIKSTISELNVRKDTQEGIFNYQQDDIINRESSGTLYVWMQTMQEAILPDT